MLNKLRLLAPGPTPLPEEVRQALARDMIHHRKPDFRALMARVQEKAKILFDSANPVLPLACSGTGAMAAAVGSLFNPGQKVLVVEAGKFGQRWAEIARSRELEIARLEVEWGRAVKPGAIKTALARDPQIAGVLLQHCETSTGVMNPLREISEVMRGANALLVVDGISAVGIAPCPMDAWGIDCLLTGSQKGLMLPPGLALLSLSNRAWEIARANQSACFYFNLPKERENLEKGQTNFTSAINLIVGLEASLNLLLQNGLDAVYEKQRALTALARTGLRTMGLELLAKENFAWGVTAALMPEKIDGQKILAFCEREFGVVMAGGQDRLKGRIIRLGHMGWVDWSDCIAGLFALAAALKEYGFETGNDFGPAAMRAYRASLA